LKEKPMPQVNVLVNGRPYTVACAEGEERHVQALANAFDRRVQALSASVGQVGEPRLLLMAGLVVADELHEMALKFERCAKELADLKAAQAQAAEIQQIRENSAADALEGAALRVEAIAARLSHA
jgi:cell division protein ZapA